jgi:hypothetical protein
MGHILGLDDYYSYDDDDWEPTGTLDMQAWNILDHNAYSKYLMGWIDPIVIDGTSEVTTINLDPFEASGDAILIKNDWNGSAFDEYLMLEFYTPTGLNYADSIGGPYNNRYQGFTIPGIKLLHVDSRLAKYTSSGSFISYTDTLDNGSTNFALIGASNTASRSIDSDYRLIHLIEAGGVNTFINGSPATNDTLFVTGDTFTPSSFASFFTMSGAFNSGEPIGYAFEIVSINSSGAVIEITRL